MSLYLTLEIQNTSQKPQTDTIEIPDSIIISGMKEISFANFFEQWYCGTRGKIHDDDTTINFVSLTDDIPEEGNPLADFIRREKNSMKENVNKTIRFQKAHLEGSIHFAEKALDYYDKKLVDVWNRKKAEERFKKYIN
jgi:hypothetical protein